MRTSAVILFSALLLITQGLAAWRPAHLANPSTCCGCACTQRACCTPTTPRSAGQPAQPLSAQRASVSAQDLARALVGESSGPSASASLLRESSFALSASPRTRVVPLFLRHCALLL